MTNKDPTSESTSPSSSGEKRPLLRRSFLLKISAILAAGGVGNVAFNDIRIKNRPVKYDHAGDQSRPVSQQEIDQLYASLYLHIKNAKEQAEQDHKDLVILMGEVHTYSLSLLNNLMIADIAARLGIRECICETDDKDSSAFWKDSLDFYRKLNVDYIDQLSLKNPNVKKLLSDYDRLDEKDKKDVDLVSSAFRAVHADPKWEIFITSYRGLDQHGSIFDLLLSAHRYRVSPGDPLRSKINDRHHPELEGAMADAMQQVHGHRLACYGISHLPVLHDALKKNPSLQLLTLDTSNLLSDLKTDREVKLHAMEQGKPPEIFKPIIQGKPPSDIDAYRMAMRASLAHREKTAVPDRITVEQSKLLKELMDAIYQKNMEHRSTVSVR